MHLVHLEVSFFLAVYFLLLSLQTHGHVLAKFEVFYVEVLEVMKIVVTKLRRLNIIMENCTFSLVTLRPSAHGAAALQFSSQIRHAIEFSMVTLNFFAMEIVNLVRPVRTA